MKTLEKQYAELKGAILAVYDAAEQEDRLLTEDEKAAIAAKEAELDELDERIKQAEKQAAMRREFDAKGFGKPLDGDDSEADSGQQDAKALKSARRVLKLGTELVNSEAYKQMRSQFPADHIPEKAHVNSQPVEVKELLTGLSAISAGAFVVPDQTGIVEELGRYPLNVLGLVSRTPTSSDTFEWVRQTRHSQEAAPVPEANVTDYTGASGEVEGRKPEATIRWERVSGRVVTIAQWIAATKRALADARQLEDMVNRDLVADLMAEVEYQIINGDGTGENLEGILNTTGVLTQAWDTDVLTTIRKARTTLEVEGNSYPNAILMHPNDAETLDLLTDNDGRFYYGGPVTGGVAQVWRVRVVDCQTMPEGYGLMGNFAKAVLYDRQQATISMSDSHEDFFVRNLVAILAELRVGLAVVRPQAFCIVPMESGS